MAAVLIPKEEEAAVNRWRQGGTSPPTPPWYRYAFDKLLPSGIAENQVDLNLRVITLNFDNSFESAFAYALQTSFHAHDATTLASKLIPMVHIHGRLACAHSWIRPPMLGMKVIDAPPEIVRMSLENLRVVGDELDTQAVEQARQALEWAEVVCFLGFGFHEFIETSLGLPYALIGRRSLATSYGIETGRLGQIKNRYQPVGTEFFPEQIEAFLQNREVIHEHV
jgi:hypothetical protein